MKYIIDSVKRNMNKYIINTICIIIIIVAGTCFIQRNTMIKIVGDEYGYWAAGAFFSGLDWSEITSLNSYYAQGYGLFLALILKLKLSPALTYQLAVILNVLFLCILFCIVMQIIYRWSKDTVIPEFLKPFLGLAITSSSSILFYTQFTTTEVLLNLIYWCLILLADKLLERVTVLRSILFVSLLLYGYFVHQRMIGICIISVMFWLYVIVHSEQSKVGICLKTLITLSVLACIFIILKGIYKEAFYSGGISENYALNNFSGQTQKIKYFFSIEGITSFLKAFCGKIFYASSCSNLLVGLSIYLTFKQIVLSRKFIFKREKLDNSLVILMYLSANMLIMMAIGSIYMIDYSGRFDLLIYGRYFEYTISPMILIAYFYLFKNERKNIVLYNTIIWIYIVISVFINSIINYQEPMTHIFLNCSGIAIHYLNSANGEKWILTVTIFSIIYFLIIVGLFANRGKTNKLVACLLVLFSLINISRCLKVYEDGGLSWINGQSQSEIEFSKTIHKMNIEDSLYYYVNEGDMDADYLQFLLKDNTIHTFDDKSEIYELQDDIYILTIKDTMIEKDLFTAGYRLLDISNKLKLWGKVDY